MSATDIRARVLNAADLDSVIEHVPEWDVTLKLVTPDGDERASLALLFSGDDAEDEAAAKERTAVMFPLLIAICAHDPETGERVFTDDDIEALRRKNGAVVWRVGQKCLEIAGMTADADVEAGKDSE